MSAMPPFSSSTLASPQQQPQQQPSTSSATLTRQASYSRRMRLSQSSAGNGNAVAMPASSAPTERRTATSTGTASNSGSDSPYRRAQAVAAGRYTTRSDRSSPMEEPKEAAERRRTPNSPRNKVAARVQMFESHNTTVQFEKSPRHAASPSRHVSQSQAPQSRNDSPQNEVSEATYHPSVSVSAPVSPKGSRNSAFTAVPQSYQPSYQQEQNPNSRDREGDTDISTPHNRSMKAHRRSLRNGTSPSSHEKQDTFVVDVDHTPSTSNVTSNVTHRYLPNTNTHTNASTATSSHIQSRNSNQHARIQSESLSSSYPSNSNVSTESLDLTERRRKMALARRYHNNSNKPQGTTNGSNSNSSSSSTTVTHQSSSLTIDPLDKEAFIPDSDPLDKESKNPNVSSSSCCVSSPSRRRKMDRAAAAKRHRRQVQEQRMMGSTGSNEKDDSLSLLEEAPNKGIGIGNIGSEESGGTGFSTVTGINTAMTGHSSVGLSKGDYTTTSRTETTAMSSTGTWDTHSGIGDRFERDEFDMDSLENGGIVSNSPFRRQERDNGNIQDGAQVSKFDPFAASSAEEMDKSLEFRNPTRFTQPNIQVPSSPRLEPSMFDSAPGSSPRRHLMSQQSPSGKSPSRRRERNKASPSRHATQSSMSSHASEGMYKLSAAMSYNDDDDDTQFNSVSMPYTRSVGPVTPTGTSSKPFSPKSPDSSSLFSGNMFEGSAKMNTTTNSQTQNSINNGDDESLTESVNGSWTGRMRARQKVEALAAGRNPQLATQEAAVPRSGIDPSPSKRSIHKPLVPGEVIPSLPNYDYTEDMRDGVEEVTKFAKEDPPAVAVTLGALGVLCGTMILGPIGLLLGAAGVGVGYGVMQMPDDQRTKVKGKAQRAAERLQESALAANEVVSSSCAAACGQSGTGEAGAATMDTENLANHHPSQPYPPHVTTTGAERYHARGYPSPPHIHTQGVHGIGITSVHPSSPSGHARSPEAILANNLPPNANQSFTGNVRPNMANRRLVPACRRMGRITPVNQIHSLDPSLHPRAWLDVMASAWTSREEKNEAMEEILILAKDKGHSRMLLEVRIQDYFPSIP